ncbi:hypothetical protein ABGB17_20335 [Sphaerisporangium sp. B11E5]|uniref:hypothetical protein n=1 Tax=Sphaerisporangium sp. B11E5 TaxID=3153563 RepID=UPI00325E8E13
MTTYGPGYHARLYRYPRGTFTPTDRGAAALFGITEEQARLYGKAYTDPPAAWVKALRRLTREAAAHLGYTPDLRQLLDYIAERDTDE